MGSYRQLRTAGFDFKKLIGYSDESAAVVVDGHADGNDGNNRVRDAVQSPVRGPRESVTKSAGEYNPGGKRAEPGGPAGTGYSRPISKDVYVSYFLAGGGKLKTLFFLFVHALSQVLTTGSDYWINYW